VAGRVRQAWAATTSASAATVVPTTANVEDEDDLAADCARGVQPGVGAEDYRTQRARQYPGAGRAGSTTTADTAGDGIGRSGRTPVD